MTAEKLLSEIREIFGRGNKPAEHESDDWQQTTQACRSCRRGEVTMNDTGYGPAVDETVRALNDTIARLTRERDEARELMGVTSLLAERDSLRAEVERLKAEADPDQCLACEQQIEAGRLRGEVERLRAVEAAAKALLDKAERLSRTVDDSQSLMSWGAIAHMMQMVLCRGEGPEEGK